MEETSPAPAVTHEDCRLHLATARARPANVQHRSRGTKVGSASTLTPSMRWWDEYPLPYENADILAGLAIHEAYHSKMESFKVNPKFPPLLQRGVLPSA